jgi:adenylate cyclase class IV
MAVPPRANLEIKARLRDPAAALRRAEELEPRPHSVERQVDTYFTVPRGRLKLRRRWTAAEPRVGAVPDREQPCELIAYGRPNAAAARRSDYLLLPLPPETRVEDVLALATGVDARVEKVRTVFLHDDVRVHLDEVAGLGSFLELEAILDESCDEAAAARKIERLRAHFGTEDRDLVAASYRELQAAARAASGT